MFKKTKKIIIAMLVFVLTIVNYGLPIKAIATEGKGLFNLDFFKKDVIAFNVYFDIVFCNGAIKPCFWRFFFN